MKFANKFCRDLHKSYTLGFGLLETRINTVFVTWVTMEWE